MSKLINARDAASHALEACRPHGADLCVHESCLTGVAQQNQVGAQAGEKRICGRDAGCGGSDRACVNSENWSKACDLLSIGVCIDCVVSSVNLVMIKFVAPSKL